MGKSGLRVVVGVRDAVSLECHDSVSTVVANLAGDEDVVGQLCGMPALRKASRAGPRAATGRCDCLGRGERAGQGVEGSRARRSWAANLEVAMLPDSGDPPRELAPSECDELLEIAVRQVSSQDFGLFSMAG